jgi:type I site-specific restriction-modification system R (restriction) subunit
MEPLNLPTYLFRLKEDRGKKYIFDEIRRRFVLLTPEEWVRQHIINFLVQVKNFPRNLISIEKGFNQNRNRQRYDLLIFNNLGNPMMIVECKAPGVEINQQVFDQAGRYNNRHKANYMLITNGVKHYCCMINLENRQYAFLNDVPDYSTMMAAIVQK